MIDQDAFIRETARFFGHTVEDALAARDLLHLRNEDVVARFTEAARFARTFGLNIRSVAGMIAESGTGIEPWEATVVYSSQDRAPIREAEKRFAKRGDWGGTILALLDEVDRLRDDVARPSPDA